ncbi:MAG: replication factor C small subunit [Candidatus Woesearchaeota archaeon]|nr:replication factor C small subunit [Candidatus Woesearchaeota archaeon]
MDNAMWTEKYRPSDFSEISGQDETVKRVKAFVKNGNMPHLLFAGPAGTGKTSLAIVISRKLFGEQWKENFLELNASDERGINVIRENVKNFARTRTIGDVPFKIIYLDESDALTREAQQALRRTMENYTRTCRFILSCNYSSKIIEPIQSRCAVFRFQRLKKEDIFSIMEKIAKAEKLTLEEGSKEALYEASGGDCRKLENIMQSCAALSAKITEKSVYDVASFARPKELKEILETALAGRFEEAKEKFFEVMTRYGLSGIDIIKQLQSEIMNLLIEPRAKMRLIEKTAEFEFRMVEGSDERVQLEALLAAVCLAGSISKEKDI